MVSFVTVLRFSLTELPYRFRQWRYETKVCCLRPTDFQTRDYSEYRISHTTHPSFRTPQTVDSLTAATWGVWLTKTVDSLTAATWGGWVVIETRYSGNTGYLISLTISRGCDTTVLSAVSPDLW